MTASEDTDPIAALAQETVAPIKEELFGRLTVRVGERDALALESALLKAFIGGMQAGEAEAAESETALELDQSPAHYSEQPFLPTQLDLPLPQLDPWAERYGER